MEKLEHAAPSYNRQQETKEKFSSISEMRELMRRAYRSSLPYVISAAVGFGTAAIDSYKTDLKRDASHGRMDFNIKDEKKAALAYENLHDGIFDGDTVNYNAFVKLESNVLPEALLHQDNVHFVEELQKHFIIDAYSLDRIVVPHEAYAETPALPADVYELKKYEKTIKDITTTFPEGYKPAENFLPDSKHINSLGDSTYVKGLMRYGSTRITPYGFDVERIKEMATDDVLFTDFKGLSTAGPATDFSPDLYDVPKKDLHDFVQNNLDLLPHFSGSPFSVATLYTLKENAEVWRKNFNEPAIAERIQRLQEKGYSMSAMVSTVHESKNLMNDEKYADILVAAAPLLSPEARRDAFLGRVMANSFTKGFGSYLDITNDSDQKEFLLRIKKYNEKLKDGSALPYTTFEDLIESIETDIRMERMSSMVSEYPKEMLHRKEFFEDEGINIMEQLGYMKTTPDALKSLPERERIEWIVRTCRNMSVAGMYADNVNEKVFLEYLKKGIEMRSDPEIANIELFKDRNVAVFAGNERLATQDSLSGSFDVAKNFLDSSQEKRFANPKMLEGLEAQHPKAYKVFRASTDLHDLIKTKEEFLAYVENTEKLTIFVEAHGDPWNISLTQTRPDNISPDSSSHIQAADFTTSSNITDALIARYTHGHHDRAVLVVGSCYNQNLIRNIYQGIEEYNKKQRVHVPLPVAIGTTENNQFAFSDFSDPYRNAFTHQLFDLGKKHTLRLQDAFTIEGRYGRPDLLPKGMAPIYSNPSIFVPYEQIRTEGMKKAKREIHFQVAQAESTKQQTIKESLAALYESDLKRGAYMDGTTASYFKVANPDEAKRIEEKLRNEENLS